MVSRGTEAAQDSLQTSQKEINDHHKPGASSHAEHTIPKQEAHARVILPIRYSTKRRTSIREQSGHTVAPLEQHEHLETNHGKGKPKSPQLDDYLH